jgi:hypothetical protein
MRLTWTLVAFALLWNGLIVLTAKAADPTRSFIKWLFGESGPLTTVSVVQILACSALAAWIFVLRKKSTGRASPCAIWMIMALGFVFLAFDERAQIHERFDFWVHHALDLEKTDVTDRLDDVVVGFYGVCGLAAIWMSRREGAVFADARPWFIAGFAVVLFMVVCDIFTDRLSWIRQFIDPNRDQAKAIQMWLAVAEDVFKLQAEQLFLCGLAVCVGIARRPALTPPAAS